MKIINANTAKGRRLLNSCAGCSFPNLHYLYDNFSYAKEQAYNYCYDLYANDPNRDIGSFGVGNANCFSFSASWLTRYDGYPCWRLETRDNSYAIVFYDEERR